MRKRNIFFDLNLEETTNRRLDPIGIGTPEENWRHPFRVKISCMLFTTAELLNSFISISETLASDAYDFESFSMLVLGGVDIWFKEEESAKNCFNRLYIELIKICKNYVEALPKSEYENLREKSKEQINMQGNFHRAFKIFAKAEEDAIFD